MSRSVCVRMYPFIGSVLSVNVPCLQYLYSMLFGKKKPGGERDAFNDNDLSIMSLLVRFGVHFSLDVLSAQVIFLYLSRVSSVLRVR